jgi:hypothetical protein
MHKFGQGKLYSSDLIEAKLPSPAGVQTLSPIRTVAGQASGCAGHTSRGADFPLLTLRGAPTFSVHHLRSQEQCVVVATMQFSRGAWCAPRRSRLQDQVRPAHSGRIIEHNRLEPSQRLASSLPRSTFSDPRCVIWPTESPLGFGRNPGLAGL